MPLFPLEPYQAEDVMEYLQMLGERPKMPGMMRRAAKRKAVRNEVE